MHFRLPSQHSFILSVSFRFSACLLCLNFNFLVTVWRLFYLLRNRMTSLVKNTSLSQVICIICSENFLNQHREVIYTSQATSCCRFSGLGLTSSKERKLSSQLHIINNQQPRFSSVYYLYKKSGFV